MSVYDFKVTGRTGESVDLNNYRGQVLLIVNSATECGFTPQYTELNKIFERYSDKGFTILDFPCNQFGNQAPGTNEEIANFCTGKYGVNYPIFSKIDVNGENADPLYQYLVSQKGFEGFDPAHQLSTILDDILTKLNPDYKKEPSIKWNFTKFLVDRDGEVVARFEPTADLSSVSAKIEELL